MKKIIKNKCYDTATAKERGSWSNGLGYRDFAWCEETLYQKKTGEYFLHGAGGPMSRYSRSVGGNTWESGEKIIPMTLEEAREWAEEHLDGDEYEAIFGPVSEGGDPVTTGITLTSDAMEILRRYAHANRKSYGEILSDLIRKNLPNC